MALSKEVEIGGTEYVVLSVDAQTQYKILQKLARHGVAPLVSGMAQAEQRGEDMKTAFMGAILAIIHGMPEADQDYCINESLKKTAVKGESDPVTISKFTGRIGEWVMLGVRAIGVQLGDFSCFQSLIPSSTAGAPEETE